jgi:hypothetical protein
MNKIPIILGILVIILFAICMNTKEFFTSPLNIFTGIDQSEPKSHPLMTTSDEKLNYMNSDSFFNGTFTLTDDEFKPTGQNIEVIVFKRNYDLLFLVKSVVPKTAPAQSCTSSEQCMTGVCDTTGEYGCQNKCIVADRDSSESDAFNCSPQMGGQVILGTNDITNTNFRTYKTVKATITNNFKTTGTFVVDSGESLSSYREYELENILPPGSQGDFKKKNGVIYFTNNDMTFTKVQNDTYENFTNSFRDTSNQYYTNIPQIIPPNVQVTTTDTQYQVQAGHSNNYLLNPILNLDITNNCSILNNITTGGFKNFVIFTKTSLTDNQGEQVFKSLGTQFFGPNSDESSLILEVTDLTKYIHGTTESDVVGAVQSFKDRLQSLESKEESIAQEYMDCINSSSNACDYGSSDQGSEESGCTDLLSGELYSLENEIDSMEITQWKIEPLIKQEGANICAFQMHTTPEYNTLKTVLWAEANNNGTAGLSLERGGDMRNKTFDNNGKSQNWYFDDGELIGTSGDGKMGLYRVKIRSTNGLYLTPSKSFQGLNNMTTRTVLTRDNSTWWYLLATTDFNTSVLTVLNNNLQMNTMFVDNNTATNSRTNYYCPTSYPYRYGSAESGYYCSTKEFTNTGTTEGTKCCLEKGLSSSCDSQCCPTNVCPTDMTEESGTKCYPEGDVGSTSNFCDLTGTSANGCYP